MKLPRSFAGMMALLLAAAGCVGNIEAAGGTIDRGGAPAAPPTTGTGMGMGMGTTPPRTGGANGGEQPAPGTGGAPAPVGSVAPGRMRRLTRAQLQNSLRDLLGDVTLGALEPDDLRDGFASVGATYSAVSPRSAELYESALLKVLADLFADPARRAALFVGRCTPRAADDQECLRRFLEDFGQRAWRRPLTSVEVDRYTQLAMTINRSYGDATTGLMHAISGLLASPHFLYRVELGQPDPAAGGRFRFTAWEMASRLSFLFWNGPPDPTLREAARNGGLDRPEGVRAQATRLLASERAKEGLGAFARELYELDKLAASPKPDPRYTEGLRAAMATEITEIFAANLRSGATVGDLLDGKRTFVNGELAKLYGIPGVTGAATVEAPLPEQFPRVGLLGSAAFLALQSPQTETSPTGRGVFVNERVLCRHIPEPPDNVDTTLPDPPQGVVLSKRERLDGHRANASCAACHALFDPIGYAFEHFDEIGGYRDKEPNGKPIDATGQFDGKPFANARELAAILRALPDSQRCLVQNLFRVASGHGDSGQDIAIIDAWEAELGRAGGRLSEFLVAVTASDGFRYAAAAP